MREKIQYAAWMFIFMSAIMVGLLLAQEYKHDKLLRDAVDPGRAVLEEQIEESERSGRNKQLVIECQAKMIVGLVDILGRHGVEVVLVEEGGAVEVAPVK